MTKTFTAGTFTTRQRDLANLRERRRMMLINRGFEQLKGRLPLGEDLVSCINTPASQDHHQKSRQRSVRLTKVDILRLTIQYINQLRALLASEQVPQGRLPIACSLGRTLLASKDGFKLRSSDRRLRLDRRQPDSKLDQRKTRPTITTATTAPSSRHGHLDPSQICIGTNDGVATCYSQCIGGRKYSFSWSRSQRLTEFFLDEQTLGVQLEMAQSKRVLRNTKLWVPERENDVGSETCMRRQAKIKQVS